MNHEISDIQPHLPKLTSQPGLGGQLKQQPEDFLVEELRPNPLSGEGEHWIVRIIKRDLTTDQVAAWLAKRFAVPQKDVGFAGQKDRQAVTIQDFSVYLPGQAPPQGWADDPLPGITIHSVGRDRRKIKPGMLSGNRFVIRLRGCDGALSASQRQQLADATQARLLRYGAPNYFGPQRFGRDGDNWQAGLKLLRAGRKRRKGNRNTEALQISAVRSELFNRVVTARLQQGLFNTLLLGDVVQLAGRTAAFRVEDLAAEQPRFDAVQIHPTGPLFGRDMLAPTGQAAEIEAAIAQAEPEAIELLEQFDMQGVRKSLRLIPGELSHHWEQADLIVTFTLPRGCFATSIMREYM
ncbi:Pseudouridylate synthase [Magnetococcus marinus MC-1]|uniref:tRNA pseudouridine synthase D n=1 Tax=Magnetococcus marinus (strain ATCC BAA-1437 / JCM 17883 / MC-1) TaxID=156889 RepID=A0L3X2_MAGMM|nr:tRNA pseudouridine(13) synthase TruD [Magnetococcus marinus]ABK42665.1 Pseudouridylate synthase [Magnetococcus marinus MC-1]